MNDFTFVLRQKISELKSISGRATELLSLYVPKSKTTQDVLDYLRFEQTQSQNIKSKENRKKVLSNLEKAYNKILTTPETNDTNYCIFSSSNSRTIGSDYFQYLNLQDNTLFFQYSCSSKFILDQLLKYTEDLKKYVLFVFEKNESTIGLLNSETIDIVKEFTSNIPGKHRAGGQSSHRFERVIKLATHDFILEVSTYLNNYLKTISFDGILLGGPGKIKEKFITGEYLEQQFLKKILSVQSTAYSGLQGLKELLQKSKTKLIDLEIFEIKHIIERYFLQLKKNKACSIYDFFFFLEKKQINTILLFEDARLVWGLFECFNCAFYKKKIFHSTKITQVSCLCGKIIDVQLKDFVQEIYFQGKEKKKFKVQFIQRKKNNEESMQLESFDDAIILLNEY